MSINRTINANTIGDEVYENLKQSIINLTIKPGQTLTEQEICETYGISRTPSRDVLQRLKSDGLVTSIPYKGNYVSLLDLDKIQQLIYMRTVLEIQIIKDAIALDHPLFLSELEWNLKRQEALIASDFKPEDFYKIDSEFHQIWFKVTEKLAVWDMIERSQIHYTRFRMLDIVVVKNFGAIFKEHKALYEMIKLNNINEIEEALHHHLNGGIERLGEKLYTEFAEYFVNQKS